LRLSKKEDWQYQNLQVSLRDIQNFADDNEWVERVLNLVPHSEMSYLELGCSPGICSAAVARGTSWSLSGVDFSEGGTIFLKTLKLVGKSANFYRADIFEFKTDKLYDIVASYGLIEHFSGGSLDKILNIHDECLSPGGYLLIELPNFTGFQYFWHYLFDKPNLDIHNVDIMSPTKIANSFQEKGYEILFSDYVGCAKFWGSSRFNTLGKVCVRIFQGLLNKFFKFTSIFGIKINGGLLSPHILFLAIKNEKRII
jgi:2-polyprenyl-3-methyl-5-hydroxy-6-metoxy-1,4-benzoquinol methylase